MFEFEKARESFSFVKKFKIFGIISIILCSIGLAGIILSFFDIPAFNFDIDFVGGVSMEIDLGTEVTSDVQENIVNIYKDVADVTATVTTSGNSGTSILAKTVEIDSDTRQAVFDKISEEYGEDNVTLLSTDYVSASVGNDLKRSAFLSTIIACLLILIYISIRFEFKSGLAAIICLVHDVLVMLGFFVVSRLPMNMTFIAAALTIVGYSINATIVVFDRIRENYKIQGNRGDFAAVVDKSVWQSMGRSIGTTITTLLPVLFIIILGVTSIRIFALPLMVGIVCGGYSSTCIAGPVWNMLRGKKA